MENLKAIIVFLLFWSIVIWDGNAKKNFSSAVESDAVQMNNFSSLIEQYCAALETIISRYETTEANNASTVAKRTY